MYSINRYSYLHNYFSELNPRVLNRSVDRALGLIVTDVHDLEPPFNRLSSEQPNIPEENVDVIHRPVGYGRWALPKLRHDLSSKDECVVVRALETIMEQVIDPEKAFQAIKLKIIDRMENLLMSENPAIRERTAVVLWGIGKLSEGREIIAANKGLLNNISIVVEDSYEEVRLHMAKLLETVATFWKAADELIDFGFIPILLQILKQKEEKYIKLIHIRTLQSLMYDILGKTIALDNNGMEIMLEFIQDENSDVVSESLTCISLMTSTCVGEKLARDKNLLDILNKLLHVETPEIHTNAASVIMYCTVKAAGKLMAAEHPTMLPRLIQLSQNRLNPATQMFCIKALTNISENPKIRHILNAEYAHEITLIQVGDDKYMKSLKDILMEGVNWIP